MADIHYKMENLYNDNTPSRFWRLALDISENAWLKAAEIPVQGIPGGYKVLAEGGWTGLGKHVLGEGQFGQYHWQLSRVMRLYYILRPFLPVVLRPILKRLSANKKKAVGFPLGWPIEDRYSRFLFATVKQLLQTEGLMSVPHLHFWPNDKQFAFVLTHDVESKIGYDYVRAIASLEEKYDFRSCFNFVPHAYAVERDLLAELQDRGFEVGVHGLKHDGRLFSSRKTFSRRAKQINRYVQEWGVSGFRAPMMHRQPDWLQELDIRYDTSFFDSDPFEPIPGGTMSIWPFFLGRFVELPYTLVQDHTLMQTLGETTPQIWLEKVDHIRRFCGMALLNSHPDYLKSPTNFAIYEEFLHQMSLTADYWHCLPSQVAQWWRDRADAIISHDGTDWTATGLPGATFRQLDTPGMLVGSNTSRSKDG